jgi:glycosyltransferase involved in cell wall biosynthesis
VIVGDGPESEALKQQAKGLDNVRFTGALVASRVDEWFRRATVFVMPSVPLAGQTEGQPRAVMEAMAAGLPVVASRTGGIPELVDDGKGGQLVAPGDATALADAIVSVLSNPAAATQMGKHNRAVIEPRNFGKIEQQVTALFEKLAAANRK